MMARNSVGGILFLPGSGNATVTGNSVQGVGGAGQKKSNKIFWDTPGFDLMARGRLLPSGPYEHLADL